MTVNRIYPVTVFCVLLAVSAAAQTTPAAAEGPVTVTSGEGSVKRAPDRAWVHVSVESRAKSPREAQKLNADAMSAVLQKLKGSGLSGEAIQTRGYDLQPEFDYATGDRRCADTSPATASSCASTICPASASSSNRRCRRAPRRSAACGSI